MADRLRELGADVYVSARSMPNGYEFPGRFIAADTTTVEGTDAVADRLTDAGGVDILVHVVGGASTPAGGFGLEKARETVEGGGMVLAAQYLGQDAAREALAEHRRVAQQAAAPIVRLPSSMLT